MKTTTHQTVVIPQGEAGTEFLRQLLMGGKTWEQAHAESPGDDILIEECDGHCGDCGQCSKCYPHVVKERSERSRRETAEALSRNRREDERAR